MGTGTAGGGGVAGGAPGAGGGLSEDARLELSMLAGQRERSSRPTALVVLAGAALLVAGLGAVLGLRARGEERSLLRSAVNEQAETERLLFELGELESRQRAAGDKVAGERIPDVLSKIEGLGRRTGMKQQPAPPRETQTVRSGYVVREYTYSTMSDPSLKSLMDWVSLVTTEIPGMEVASLSLRPDPVNWTMTVTFRRWERAG